MSRPYHDRPRRPLEVGKFISIQVDDRRAVLGVAGKEHKGNSLEEALAVALPGLAGTATLAGGATVLRMLLEPTEHKRQPTIPLPKE